jgi:hypothetical protein
MHARANQSQPAREPGYDWLMDSKLARQAKDALLAANQRLSPEQRLNAFLAHSRLMVALFAAGKRLRADSRRTAP